MTIGDIAARCLGWPILFIRLTCYLGRSRSIQLSRSISCDLAAISPIREPFFFSSSRCARIDASRQLYMGRSRSRSRSRNRDRGRDRSHSSSSSSSEDSAEREERMQRERDDREGGGAPRRSGGLGRYLALSGAIWRYLALSGYLILSHSISCRSDKRIGQTRPVVTVHASRSARDP